MSRETLIPMEKCHGVGTFLCGMHRYDACIEIDVHASLLKDIKSSQLDIYLDIPQFTHSRPVTM
jgi:hypothetical protein